MKLRTHDFLRDVWNVGEPLLRPDPSWACDILVIEQMLKQRVTKGGFNFRHGSTYLTSSRTSAVRYTVSNRFGSELLSYALDLFETVMAADSVLGEQLATRYPSLTDFLSLDPSPVLIEVGGVQIQQIRSETGEEASSVIDIMEEINGNVPSELCDKIYQRQNFELITPVSPECLRCFRIKWLNSDTALPEYELEPI